MTTVLLKRGWKRTSVQGAVINREDAGTGYVKDTLQEGSLVQDNVVAVFPVLAACLFRGRRPSVVLLFHVMFVHAFYVSLVYASSHGGIAYGKCADLQFTRCRIQWC